MPGLDDEILERPYQARAPGACVYQDSAVSDLFDDEILDRPVVRGVLLPVYDLRAPAHADVSFRRGRDARPAAGRHPRHGKQQR